MSDQRLCGACGEANPGRAKFCLECGAALAPPETGIIDALPQQAAGGERRVVSVLFADLSGFTSFSEQTDVEEVRAIAHETADKLGEIVVRYGGIVDKVIGDCVMAVWGAPTSHEDDAERAVRAALDMQAHIADNADRFAGLPLSIGVNTGEAIWAEVGGQHTVLGDTVNTAARLQGAAARGEILVGETTYSRTEGAVAFEVVEPIVAKNKKDPVPAFKALSVMGDARRRRPTSIPLVGRAAEQERLTELWELARTEGRPYGALLLGPAGVGKTRLVQALATEIGHDATLLHGSCLPYGEGITYWPVVEMIKQAADIKHDDDHVEVSAKLGALLEGLGSQDVDELRTMAVAIANLVGEPTTPRGTYTATEISKGELHWGLRRILELAARTQPIVVVIDDLHWAEPALLELVDHLLEPRSGVAMLAVGTARPELRDSHPGFAVSAGNRRVFELDALNDQAALELVRRLIGEGDVSDETLRQLLEAAGGNPLFLEQVVQAWIDSGADPAALASMEVPHELRSLIASRLDRLPPGELRLLGHAAVVGDVFWSGVLGSFGSDERELQPVLSALQERDLIRTRPSTSITGQREFAFTHGMIRDVAYSRIPKSSRAALHESCGGWMGTMGEDEFAEIIAYHLEEACKLAAQVSRSAQSPPILGAVKALTRAAEKSEGREGIHEAARFYDRALTLLGTGYLETSTDLRLRRARMEAALGELDRAYADLYEVASASEEVGRDDLRCRALVNLVDTGIALGRIREARSYLEKAEKVARLSTDPLQMIRVAFVRAIVNGSLDGDVEAAERDLRGAVELAEEAGDVALLAVAELRLGVHRLNVGRPAEAAEAFRHVAELAVQRGSLRDQATATLMLAGVLHLLGPRREAESLAMQSIGWFERLANPHMLSQALEVVGRLALARDDAPEAQKLFLRALEVSPGDRLSTAGLNRYLAEARARQGRAIGARAAAAAAAEASYEQEPATMALAAVASGWASTAEGVAEAARDDFERGIGTYEEMSLPTSTAEARVAYARSLLGFGEAQAAAEQLGLARAAYEAVGASAAIDEIDSVLSAGSIAAV